MKNYFNNFFRFVVVVNVLFGYFVGAFTVYLTQMNSYMWVTVAVIPLMLIGVMLYTCLDDDPDKFAKLAQFVDADEEE